MKAVNDAGYFAFVITNQSGVARGYYEEHHVVTLHRWMADQMAEVGAHIDAFEYCPDHPDGTVASTRAPARFRACAASAAAAACRANPPAGAPSAAGS